MTDEELIQWGRKEAVQRTIDLNKDRSAVGLKAAQDAARKRRAAVGLTSGQAVQALALAAKADWRDKRANARS